MLVQTVSLLLKRDGIFLREPAAHGVAAWGSWRSRRSDASQGK